ncbi:hypothetical protein BDK51DRAFT_39015 [Blyttiomyces helicus]|uniref:Ankyrin repeat-containing domain protein n=1 Tax=Blyttiomyces helicus TaxID=388810 RepID=A0A4P9WLD5_9FUNG|nr:hypothetical protein BDK51DRAFT_39015 [Blyttiomyces helicus]|eukprot:RKO92408.1 hypothetical protein BDK51DRAFT_39015 [Blyttiomyces helicus]
MSSTPNTDNGPSGAGAYSLSHSLPTLSNLLHPNRLNLVPHHVLPVPERTHRQDRRALPRPRRRLPPPKGRAPQVDPGRQAATADRAGTEAHRYGRSRVLCWRLPAVELDLSAVGYLCARRLDGEDSAGGDDFDGDVEEEEERLVHISWRASPLLFIIIRNRWDAVRFLVETGFSTKHSVDIATTSGAELDDVRYLFSLGHEGVASPLAFKGAMCDKNPTILRLLHALGLAVPDEMTMMHACLVGWLDVVACLFEIGAPFHAQPGPDFEDLRIGDDAAAKGHISAVKFLDGKAPPNVFTSCAMDLAAECSLDVVRFLHESRSKGCIKAAMNRAAASGQLDIIRFLPENRTEGCTTQAMDTPVERWADPGRADAAQSYKDVVLFLHAKRSEGCTTRAMDAANVHGWLHIVQFLHENRSEGCSTDALDTACTTWARLEATMARTAPNIAGTQKKDNLKEVIYFICDRCSERPTADAITAAYEYESTEVLRFLLAAWPDLCSLAALSGAFSAGLTELLRVMYEAGRRFSDEDAKQMIVIASSERELEPEREEETFLREMHGFPLVRSASEWYGGRSRGGVERGGYLLRILHCIFENIYSHDGFQL